MRVIFCGDRNWTDDGWIIQIMSALHSWFPKLVVIEGEARGADMISRRTAVLLRIPYDPYPADWDTYHKAAGPIRNRQMVKEGKAQAVVAFHHNIEESKGTKDMVTYAKKQGLPVWVCTEGEEAFLRFLKTLKKL